MPRLVCLILGLTALCASALISCRAEALNPNVPISQYKHTIWSVDEGAPRDVHAIAQGHDGFLWMGSGSGLYRFDGVNFEHIPSSRPTDSPETILSLIVARDGTVWFGYRHGGLAVYSHGTVTNISTPPNYTGGVLRLAQTRDGAIWAQMQSDTVQLARYQNGQWKNFTGSLHLHPDDAPMDMVAAPDGTLWITTLQTIQFFKPGHSEFSLLPVKPDVAAALSVDRRGQVWLSDNKGTRTIAAAIAGGATYRTPTENNERAIFDRDGNLWVAQPSKILFRLKTPTPDGPRPGQFDKLETAPKTSVSSQTVFEDSEGNIWVGNGLGLERYRNADFVIARDEIINESKKLFVMPPTLLATANGDVYVGDGQGLWRIRPKGVPEKAITDAEFRKFGEGPDNIDTICEGIPGDVWAFGDHAIFRLHQNKVTAFVHKAHPMPPQSCTVDRSGDLWFTDHSGIFKVHAGIERQIRLPVAPENELGDHIMARRADGALVMVASPQSLLTIDLPKLSLKKSSRPRVFNFARALYPRRDDVLIAGPSGIARWRHGNLSVLDGARIPEVGVILGMAESRNGDIWLRSRDIFRISKSSFDRAIDDPRSPIEIRKFDREDGLPLGASTLGHTTMALGGDGRLWIATSTRTVWLDPDHLVHNPRPPLVVVSSITADHRIYRDPQRLTLAKGTRTIEIHFSANSLTLPKRNLVRYRLDGFDNDWIDPGMRREAVYTNLPPGPYTFRVIATNNEGIWNRGGASLEFTIPPTFLESVWFKILVAAAICVVLWLLYRARLRQVSARMQERLTIKVAERERIARDLHDTLLQGFHGLTMRLQAFANRLPAEAPMRAEMNAELDRAEAVLVEGRERLRDLRSPPSNLAERLSTLARDLSIYGSATFKISVEGEPYPMAPAVAAEVATIAEEAVRNAFRHAQARLIEATLAYSPSQFRFTLSDDGLGFPGDVLAAGRREGHYGLIGMRERATKLEGAFTLTSGRDTGTEITLRVPIAPAKTFWSRVRTFFALLWGRPTKPGPAEMVI